MQMDRFPIWLIFVGTTLLIVAAIEVGFATGKSAHRKSEEEKESPVSAIAGTVLALLAFMLAFTFASYRIAMTPGRSWFGTKRARFARPIRNLHFFLNRTATRPEVFTSSTSTSSRSERQRQFRQTPRN